MAQTGRWPRGPFHRTFSPVTWGQAALFLRRSTRNICRKTMFCAMSKNQPAGAHGRRRKRIVLPPTARPNRSPLRHKCAPAPHAREGRGKGVSLGISEFFGTQTPFAASDSRQTESKTALTKRRLRRARQAQRNFGGRFSRKADMPSFWAGKPYSA